MDWPTMANISTAIGVVVALLGAVAGFILNLRSQKLTRDGQELEKMQAEVTAERSEAAARLTEEYTRRVVEALETIATQGERGKETRVRGVAWSLTHHDGDVYLLSNVGDTAADEVEVSAHESMILRPPDRHTIEPDGAVTFIAARSLATSDSTITVRWREGLNEEQKIWRYPLPPRPPRGKRGS